jgi:tetratricopeptide (TPR) repeat protein
VSSPIVNPIEAQKRMADIHAALAASDMTRATDMAQRALDDGMADPMLHNLVAWRLEQEGRLEESAQQLERGLETFPEDVQLLTTLGFTQIALEKRPEAVLTFERTVRAFPDYAPARYGLGSAYGMLGEFDFAKANYERALALAPDYVDAWAGLADIAERLHARDEARQLLAQALRIDPRHIDARLQLARIENASGDHARAEAMVRDMLADPGINQLGRSQALVLLGDVLDRLNRHDEAWDAYVAGKGQLGDDRAAIYAGPGHVSAVAATRRRTAEFAATDPADWIEPPSAAARDKAVSHVFLLGFARSGTTLLEQILASHPAVSAFEERPTLYDTEIEFSYAEGGIERLATIHDRDLDRFREAYWYRVRDFGGTPDDKVFIDKYPMNSQHVPLIRKLFPEAKILFALRDPRDVVLSCFRRSFLLNIAMYEFTSIERAARYYDAVMTGFRLYRERLPLDLHVVRYEALVDDFEGQVRQICAFLNVDWTEDLMHFAETAKQRPIRTPSASQVTRGLYRDGMQQWRKYARQLEPVRHILAPWVEFYGYPAA